MMYLKLSIRNARRSFINYLLYVVTMTVLLAVIEVSNCITIIGELAGFQVISLPLLIAAIQIVLVGYIDLFSAKAAGKRICKLFIIGYGKKEINPAVPMRSLVDWLLLLYSRNNNRFFLYMGFGISVSHCTK